MEYTLINPKKIIYFLFFNLLSILFFIYFFKPIYISNNIIIYFSVHPFNICTEQPLIWNIIKYTTFFSYLININIFLIFLSKKFNYTKNINKNIIYSTSKNSSLFLNIGFNKDNELISIPEKSLYQNILITGTIGTGKTSSAMYPFTEQLISYNNTSKNKKLAMLILDVKGNFFLQVELYAKKYNRLHDLIILDLSGKIKYNPLDKPNLKPSVLANRLKEILLLFSPNNSESFWLDKVEQILTESIKLCRLYNKGYVTFEELHNLIMIPDYFYEKAKILKELFLKNCFTEKENYELLSSLNFFEKEYFSLDDRTKSILKSEISRITNIFISDFNVKKVFCPKQNEINFYGFDNILKTGKIVVLNMNIFEYKNLSKIIAAYLKLDFQTSVMNRLSNNSNLKNYRSVCFISDEYHEYVTLNDASFFSQSREAKCINIVATQSYTSLLNTLNNNSCVKTIIQNLINKLWFRTDDIFTIEDAQKQIGKEEKIKFSKTISENAKETNYNYLFKKFHSKNSNLSESFNSYYQTDYIFDTNYFTQKLETFSCLSFLSNGEKIICPQKINLIPYFKKNN